MRLRNPRHAQSAIELVILIGAVLFFFTVFFLLIQENMADKLKQKRNLIAMETALQVKNEIAIASETSDGYYREFDIPKKIGSQEYDISLTEDLVYIKTHDEKIALALPVMKATGQPLKGTNTIQKQEGVVYLNLE